MVTIYTLAQEKISNGPKSGPVETGPTGPVATPLYKYQVSKYKIHSIVRILGLIGSFKKSLTNLKINSRMHYDKQAKGHATFNYWLGKYKHISIV